VSLEGGTGDMKLVRDRSFALLLINTQVASHLRLYKIATKVEALLQENIFVSDCETLPTSIVLIFQILFNLLTTEMGSSKHYCRQYF